MEDVTGVHGRLRDRADVPSVLFRLATEHLFSEEGTDHQAGCGVVDGVPVVMAAKTTDMQVSGYVRLCIRGRSIEAVTR
jgi:hypothetical protein